LPVTITDSAPIYGPRSIIPWCRFGVIFIEGPQSHSRSLDRRTRSGIASAASVAVSKERWGLGCARFLSAGMPAEQELPKSIGDTMV
jgi:hypothetical protein